MKKSLGLVAAAMAALLTGASIQGAAAGEATEVFVYKTPTCGCCVGAIRHLEREGLTVRSFDVSQRQLGELRAQYGLPADLLSCHSAYVDGYLVEGHVPASAIRRLVAERPNVAGIAVPGMPLGAPGMEHPLGLREAYAVIAFGAEGERTVFAQY
ncbi:hypothetical protein J2T57_001615 [Natronocella acetinitrilica]|uniref:DUF411 domain-containing protein n=1 Tax=Natronocella acetinitrilica TaxID=414046 RepID=A0AAE3G3I4_9GAMM|nr:DUF411 domain-containing protein [Natronocella acetinitrilica]MCP1674513.1 hypothetical protein [Natronocella acetinitrilica]